MNNELIEIAKALRRHLTNAEKHLWYVLRVCHLGVKFRRQAVIGRYIVDFACFERKLIIEVDGGQHSESQDDNVRDKWLRGEGFEILRFWNHEVLENRNGVLEKIIEKLTTPSLALPMVFASRLQPLPRPPASGYPDSVARGRE
ncbi:MAG: endonuclease domain-containing protein [Chlamydiae bacterium]|nr:endonuclease domain-containing protein [Chlamydiota bacterium]MBI3265451.1 endonuclease domain-containing protein [Chlamydiota bacterium]